MNFEIIINNQEIIITDHQNNEMYIFEIEHWPSYYNKNRDGFVINLDTELPFIYKTELPPYDIAVEIVNFLISHKYVIVEKQKLDKANQSYYYVLKLLPKTLIQAL